MRPVGSVTEESLLLPSYARVVRFAFPSWTQESLPSDAKRAYEVRIGVEPWDVALAARTFTLAAVAGEIRELRVKCTEGSKRIDYKADVDWTLPSTWHDCSLQVDAEPGTTFALYEFE